MRSQSNLFFEFLKMTNDCGVEYWSSRDLEPCLGHSQWRSFENAIQKLNAMNALNDDFIKLGHLSQHYGKTLEQEAIWL